MSNTLIKCFYYLFSDFINPIPFNKIFIQWQNACMVALHILYVFNSMVIRDHCFFSPDVAVDSWASNYGACDPVTVSYVFLYILQASTVLLIY